MSRVMVRVSKEIVEAYVIRHPEFKSVSISNIVRVMLQKTLSLELELLRKQEIMNQIEKELTVRSVDLERLFEEKEDQP